VLLPAEAGSRGSLRIAGGGLKCPDCPHNFESKVIL
jgi:hypothetical protein